MRSVTLFIRWSLVFSVLGIFTLSSLYQFGILKQNNVYAESIADSSVLNAYDNFVVFQTDTNGKKSNTLCAINQNQLSMLKNTFAVSVSSTEVNGNPVNIATIDSGNGINKPKVYKTLGMSPSDVKCQLVQQQNKFLLIYLLPGVS